MNTQNLHSPEFEKELYSEVSFLDKYGMFIIVLLLSLTIYVSSNYVLRESHLVNSISENTNYTSIKGKVYTLRITTIGNFYMFSKLNKTVCYLYSIFQNDIIAFKFFILVIKI